jgi:hypothetical protein
LETQSKNRHGHHTNVKTSHPLVLTKDGLFVIILFSCASDILSAPLRALQFSAGCVGIMQRHSHKILSRGAAQAQAGGRTPHTGQ